MNEDGNEWMDSLLHLCVDSLVSVQGEWDIGVPQVSGLCAFPGCGILVKTPRLGFAWTFGKVWVNPRTLLGAPASFQRRSHFESISHPGHSFFSLWTQLFTVVKSSLSGPKAPLNLPLVFRQNQSKQHFIAWEKKKKKTNQEGGFFLFFSSSCQHENLFLSFVSPCPHYWPSFHCWLQNPDSSLEPREALHDQSDNSRALAAGSNFRSLIYSNYRHEGPHGKYGRAPPVNDSLGRISNCTRQLYPET